MSDPIRYRKNTALESYIPQPRLSRESITLEATHNNKIIIKKKNQKKKEEAASHDSSQYHELFPQILQRKKEESRAT